MTFQQSNLYILLLFATLIIQSFCIDKSEQNRNLDGKKPKIVTRWHALDSVEKTLSGNEQFSKEMSKNKRDDTGPNVAAAEWHWSYSDSLSSNQKKLKKQQTKTKTNSKTNHDDGSSDTSKRDIDDDGSSDTSKRDIDDDDDNVKPKKQLTNEWGLRKRSRKRKRATENDNDNGKTNWHQSNIHH